MEVVLRVFGGLINLTYKSCKQVNLIHMISCTNLKKLAILVSKNETCFNTEGVVLESMDTQTFLPSLEMFVCSQICLGEFSKIFEQMSILTFLELNCCYVGISVICFLNVLISKDNIYFYTLI